MSVERRDVEEHALSPDWERPNVSGDLPTVLSAAPMFRRSVAGYDRFQVDTYVQWAEEELATVDREREHLLARHLRTRAALDEARELLVHSPAGSEFLRASRRIGSMLAAAANEAEGMHAEAAADRAAAADERAAVAAEAERLADQAKQALVEAEAEAERVVADAAVEAAEIDARAGRMVDQAERTVHEARAEAEARLEKVALIEQRAAEQADRIRQQAVADATATQLRARDEIVRMMSTSREERRRADASAAASRERFERETATRYAVLVAEVEALEQRRSALRAEIELLAEPVADAAVRFGEQLRRFLERFGRSRYVRAP